MSAPDPVRVMRAFDGELSPEETADVLADPGAQGSCEGLQQLGDVLRALSEERGKAGDDIADLVMARIQLERRRSPVVAPAPARYWPLLAAAAGVALVMGVYAATHTGAPSPGPVAHQSAAPPLAVSVAAPPSPAPALVTAEMTSDSDVAIESVDFGGKNGTIFMVPGAEQGLTPVVWLVDEPGERGRVEKL